MNTDKIIEEIERQQEQIKKLYDPCGKYMEAIEKQRRILTIIIYLYLLIFIGLFIYLTFYLWSN